MKVCLKAHSHRVCMKTLCSLIFCPSGWDPAGQALVPFSPYFFIRQCWIPLPAGNEQFCFWKLAKKKKDAIYISIASSQFITVSMLPQGCIRFTTQRKCINHCRTKTGRHMVLPENKKHFCSRCVSSHHWD